MGKSQGGIGAPAKFGPGGEAEAGIKVVERRSRKRPGGGLFQDEDPNPPTARRRKKNKKS